MTMNPKVSVVIPCFNNQDFVAEAISSALSQDYQNLEVILIDDGSTDDSWQVAGKMSDARLLLFQQENQGACVARNLGLEKATGEYIKFLDADDVLAENVINQQVSQLDAAEPETIVFGYGYNFVGSISNAERYPKVIQAVDDSFAVTLCLKNILTSCALYPYRCLQQVGGFNKAVSSRQEWALNLNLYLNGYRFQYFDTLIYYRRLHDSEFRISNRRHHAAKELANLDTIFASLPELDDPDYRAAWAYVYWKMGRYILLEQGREEAEVFFTRAKSLSPENYKQYWPTAYRVAVSMSGLYWPEKLQSLLYKQYRQHQHQWRSR